MELFSLLFLPGLGVNIYVRENRRQIIKRGKIFIRQIFVFHLNPLALIFIFWTFFWLNPFLLYLHIYLAILYIYIYTLLIGLGVCLFVFNKHPNGKVFEVTHMTPGKVYGSSELHKLMIFVKFYKSTIKFLQFFDFAVVVRKENGHRQSQNLKLQQKMGTKRPESLVTIHL